MKKKLILLSAILLMCTPFVCGCNSSSDSSSSSDTPLANTGTSWDSNINEVYELALDKDTYPYSDSIYINVDQNNMLVDYTVIVGDETTSEQAVQYANDLVRAFNDSVSKTDSSIATSTDDYYGGVFDTYSFCMTIATNESVLNETDWLVCQTVKAGEHTAIQAGGYNSNDADTDTDADANAETVADTEAESVAETEAE